MSITLTLTGNSSILRAEYFPPIELSNEYECGLVDLQTYNSIPNIIDRTNNYFYIGNEEIKIPEGSYEIDDIALFLQNKLEEIGKLYNLELRANNNTLKAEIKSNAEINFEPENSIGKLLGFKSIKLLPNKIYVSELPININKVNVIRVECNLIANSYINNQAVHTLHEFSPDVGPGYKIIEVPKNVIYLPMNTKQIRFVEVKFLDQDGDLVNFNSETITARLHLKPK